MRHRGFLARISSAELMTTLEEKYLFFHLTAGEIPPGPTPSAWLTGQAFVFLNPVISKCTAPRSRGDRKAGARPSLSTCVAQGRRSRSMW